MDQFGERALFSCFLEALKASLTASRVDWQGEILEEEWASLFLLARMHHVLPLVYEAVCSCPAAKRLDPEVFKPVKRDVIQDVLLQAKKTEEALQLLKELQEAGLHPLVVKGMICRQLYPKPDYRFSGDEDLLISEEEFEQCDRVMRAAGMEYLDPQKKPGKEFEIPYGRKGSTLYIELHKQLFAPDSEVYGDWNRFFACALERPEVEKIQGADVYSLNHTDHLFYLICHAFKHFLHSGFGIRQVCDLILYANVHGSEVDWERLLAQCKEIRAEKFAAALFVIGRKYLVFSEEQSCFSDSWKQIEVEEAPLLEDLLRGGVYGKADMDRVHSSNMTLHAAADQKKGKKASSWTMVLRTAFPSAVYLEGRYPWLKKSPYLLPFAWADRLWKYRRESGKGDGSVPSNSIRIGNERVKLLRQYGVLNDR